KLGIPGTIHWVATEASPPTSFAMETESMDMFPFRDVKLRIAYAFSEAHGRTRLHRTLSYSMPTASLRLLDAVYLRRHLHAESVVGLDNLKRLVEESARTLAGGVPIIV